VIWNVRVLFVAPLASVALVDPYEITRPERSWIEKPRVTGGAPVAVGVASAAGPASIRAAKANRRTNRAFMDDLIFGGTAAMDTALGGAKHGSCHDIAIMISAVCYIIRESNMDRSPSIPEHIFAHM
jgi:hypothetical protein